MDSSEEQHDSYVIFRTRECGMLDVLWSFLPTAPLPGTHCSPSMRSFVDNSWQARFVVIILKLLHAVAKSLTWFGELVEVVLNTLNVNGGLLNIIRMILSGKGIVIPDEDSPDYLSVIGFLDPRTDLLVHQTSTDHSSYFANAAPAAKLTADVCMMASKIAYENRKTIHNVVGDEWKMHVVGVYECLNKYEPTNPTQVFIFIDRTDDAQAIVVAFRGTMPFNAYDWSTDFDFSWYELPGIGKVHVGFLEALSLVDRHDMDSFSRMKRNMKQQIRRRTSGLLEPGDDELHPPLLAYDTACSKIKELIRVHNKARVYVTGHSLGGALATVFTTILFHNNEVEICEKLAGLYTFGQPRVGDSEFAATMSGKLNGGDDHPMDRFFRVVYSNDMVPRIPFDNFLFEFKHMSPCCFYTSIYNELILDEEPNKNYFSPLYFVWNHAVAAWELVQSFILHYKYGDSYTESSASTFLRVVGLVFPGVAGHSPVNYVNAVRLGPSVLR